MCECLLLLLVHPFLFVCHRLDLVTVLCFGVADYNIDPAEARAQAPSKANGGYERRDYNSSAAADGRWHKLSDADKQRMRDLVTGLLKSHVAHSTSQEVVDDMLKLTSNNLTHRDDQDYRASIPKTYTAARSMLSNFYGVARESHLTFVICPCGYVYRWELATFVMF